jgi:hypothetical protein
MEGPQSAQNPTEKALKGPTLLALPAEIRNKIYLDFFSVTYGNNTGCSVPVFQDLISIFFVCKQIHHEARSILFSDFIPNMSFYFEYQTSLAAFMRRVPRENWTDVHATLILYASNFGYTAHIHRLLSLVMAEPGFDDAARQSLDDYDGGITGWLTTIQGDGWKVYVEYYRFSNNNLHEEYVELVGYIGMLSCVDSLLDA